MYEKVERKAVSVLQMLVGNSADNYTVDMLMIPVGCTAIVLVIAVMVTKVTDLLVVNTDRELHLPVSCDQRLR